MSDVATTTTTTPGVEPKPVDVPETPDVTSAVPEMKEEEPSAVTETTAAGAVEDTPAVPETAAEEKKEELTSDAEKKSDGLFAKYLKKLNPLPKTKKEKKKKAEEPVATEEVNKVQEETPAAVVETVAEPPKEEGEETSKPVAAVASAGEESPRPASKFARRLSSRVGNYFIKKSNQEVPSTAKVDEHPPTIDVPKPVAPLDNPASDANASAVKPVEPVQSATPVVIAAA